MIRHSIFVVFLIIVATSCSKKADNGRNDVAKELFEKSVELNARYLDSLRNASDTLSLCRIADNYNQSITAVNYQFPPDTDMNLNEEENDSLIRMSERISNIFKEKLKSFASQSDSVSIASDSLRVGSHVAVRRDSVTIKK